MQFSSKEKTVKAYHLFIFLLSGLLLSCDNDDYPYSKVPSVVLNKLRVEYPNAREVDFELQNENYEAEFEIEGDDYNVLIDPLGNIIAEKTEITWEALPAEVQQKLENEFGRNKIEDPELVKIGEEIHFQVEVKRFLIDDKLVLNESGNQAKDLSYWK